MQRDAILYDVLDGSACKDAMARMHSKLQVKLSNREASIGFGLCLGVSYDGTQVQFNSTPLIY